VAVAAAVARTAQEEGVASSAALACLSCDGGGGGGGDGDSLKRCIQSLQYDPEAAWQAAQA